MDKFAFRKCLFRFCYETGFVSKIFRSVLPFLISEKYLTPYAQSIERWQISFLAAFFFFFLMLTLIEITPAILLQPSIFFHVITAPSPQQHFSTSDEIDQKCEGEFLDVTPQRMSPFGKKMMHFYINFYKKGLGNRHFFF